MNTGTNTAGMDGAAGWVGYDASCPFCRGVRWHAARWLEPRGYAFVPLDGERGREAVSLRLPDGTVLSGADACLRLARAVWWLAPEAWLLGLRPMRPVARALYDAVSRHRAALGAWCGRRHERRGRRARATAFLEMP